jgi:hypothetical protein
VISTESRLLPTRLDTFRPFLFRYLTYWETFFGALLFSYQTSPLFLRQSYNLTEKLITSGPEKTSFPQDGQGDRTYGDEFQFEASSSNSVPRTADSRMFVLPPSFSQPSIGCLRESPESMHSLKSRTLHDSRLLRSCFCILRRREGEPTSRIMERGCS